MDILNQKKHLLSYFCIFVFYLLLGSIIPLTQDDWTWHSQYGIEMLNERFSTLNGRYFGNISEIMATRSFVMRIISYAFLSTAAIFIVAKFVTFENNKSKIKYFSPVLITFILMLLMPSNLHKQTMSWFAGFYNYIPAAIATLLIFLYITNIFINKNNVSSLFTVIFLLSSFIGQLFMENHTIYNVVLLLTSLILYFAIYKKINLKLLSGFLLTMIGFITMFSNPYYLIILKGDSSYQKVGDEGGIIDSSIETIFNTIPDLMFFNQILIVTLICILTYFLYINHPFKESISNFKNYLILSGLFILPIYKFFIYDQLGFNEMKALLSLGFLNFSVCLYFLITICYVFYHCLSSMEKKIYAIGLIIQSVFVAGPLIIAAPISYRNFLINYFIFIIIVLILISEYEYINLRLQKFIILVLPISIVLILSTFSYITYHDHKRIDTLKKELMTHKEQKKFVVEKLPFEKYMQVSSPAPAGGERTNRWLRYHGINEQNIDIIFVPFKTKEDYLKSNKLNK